MSLGIKKIYVDSRYCTADSTDDSDFKEFWDLSHIVQQYYPKIIGTIHDNNFII